MVQLLRCRPAATADGSVATRQPDAVVLDRGSAAAVACPGGGSDLGLRATRVAAWDDGRGTDRGRMAGAIGRGSVEQRCHAGAPRRRGSARTLVASLVSTAHTPLDADSHPARVVDLRSSAIPAYTGESCTRRCLRAATPAAATALAAPQLPELAQISRPGAACAWLGCNGRGVGRQG